MTIDQIDLPVIISHTAESASVTSSVDILFTSLEIAKTVIVIKIAKIIKLMTILAMVFLESLERFWGEGADAHFTAS